jgi:exodeoxyribonuclease VII large subunit
MQRLDNLSGRLDSGLQTWLERRSARIKELSAKISARALLNKIADAQRHMKNFGERLTNTERRILKDRQEKLKNLSSLLDSLSFERVLDRGYAVVFDTKGNIVSSAKTAAAEKDLKIRFRDGETAVKK